MPINKCMINKLTINKLTIDLIVLDLESNMKDEGGWCRMMNDGRFRSKMVMEDLQVRF